MKDTRMRAKFGSRVKSQLWNDKSAFMMRKIGIKNIHDAGVKIVCGLVAISVVTLSGCLNRNQETFKPFSDPLTVPATGLQHKTEVRLVEQMALKRSEYKQYLELLAQFYDRQGNQLKVSWVEAELEALLLVPKRPYLVVAEVAGSELRAAQSVVAADLLYAQATNLFKDGRSSIGFKVLSDKKNLYLARDKFNELITNYPSSDKIDDAAFQIAEISNLYLKDYQAALLYYQRVWQWDQQNPYPARFRVAQIYDKGLHDRLQALKYYEEAIKMESFPANTEAANVRILEINQILQDEQK